MCVSFESGRSSFFYRQGKADSRHDAVSSRTHMSHCASLSVYLPGLISSNLVEDHKPEENKISEACLESIHLLFYI